MTTFGRLVIALIIIVIIAVAALFYLIHGAAPAVSSIATSTPDTYGMTEYTDQNYGFTFWYPSSQQIYASSTDNTTVFPGGTDVERLDVGTQGGTYISVVVSTSSTITDEPNGHAAPINQTKYFYDISSAQWMVAYPEGSMTGGSSATTTADASQTTIGGLPMLPSGARFDTSIIPLSTTEFLVVQDGGGSGYTNELAQTVAPAGADISPEALSSALQAEAAAYDANQ